ncbi:beta-L-arabinofuranosidase domain-containing protein [Mahella australiensis]|uniref:Glycosyl hydrolase n=1 Tax=Mahella australiensis (strain DSM 15567 / CIP 107919 / 50-1 BON) TaxID=697281 RepID=F3ZYQ5_MAHA5|nr:beta-L-arabinofuranosidase domain-containing protein [Mahella australiensis]AEE97823.1 protein of unknown function DUF1680 [Mahella australiensis 50-1 BON]
MDSYAKMKELPITNITPKGWLRRYLENQRDGLTGHIDEAVGLPFIARPWSSADNDPYYNNWWIYEQTGYWVDGMTRCGYLLSDKYLIDKAKKDIEFVLEHPDEDGYLGPQILKEGEKANRWPHAVFFRAVMAYYQATGDKTILSKLTEHYLSKTPIHLNGRSVCNIEIILWLYGQTADKRLLDYALQVFEGYNSILPEDYIKSQDNLSDDALPYTPDSKAIFDTSVEGLLSDRRATIHGVTFNEIAKLGAIIYMYTGNEKYLQASVNGYKKIDRDQMLIDGVCSSAEHLRGKDPLDSHETCDIADYTWSCGYLLMATGNAEYADKIERACFNAAPGAVTSDFKALQYFSCPNQVIADYASNHNFYHKGEAWMSYRPDPNHVECCPGEVNRIMPNYAARMWMDDGKGGLMAALYGPSSITAKVGAQLQEITVIEETDYPFSEQINFKIQTIQPTDFKLTVRIPAWCKDAKLLLNGAAMNVRTEAGTFVDIKRVFQNGDVITLNLPMELKLSHWPKGGIGIERGPLVYALKIDEKWETDDTEEKCSEEFPAYDLYAASKWNYALALDETDINSKVEIVRKPINEQPWSIDSAPIEIRVPAREVKGWEMERENKIVYAKHVTEWINGKVETAIKPAKKRGDFTFTSQLPDADFINNNLGDIETVTLVPYGCTKMRIAIFPQCDADM